MLLNKFKICIALYAAMLTGTALFEAQGQYYVNKSSELRYGQPASLRHSAYVHDGLGYTYHIGSTQHITQGINIMLTKFAPGGAIEWQQQIDHQNLDDYGTAIALTPSGYVAIVGAVYHDSTQGFNAFVAVYKDDGDPVYATTWNNSNEDLDEIPTKVLVVPGGSDDVVVCGTTQTSTDGKDVFLISVDASGSLNWAETYDYTGLDDAPVLLAIDPNSDLEVSAFCKTGANGWDAVKLSYDLSGNYISNNYSSVNGILHEANTAVMDTLGQTVLCGYALLPGDVRQAVVLKLDTGMQLLWSDTLPTGGLPADALHAAVDENGEVYATGYVHTSSLTGDAFVAKWDGNGTMQWQKTYSNHSNGVFINGQRLYAGDGKIAFGGTSVSGTGTDIIAGQYDANGELLWARLHQPVTTGAMAHVADIYTDEEGRVMLNGTDTGAGSGAYFHLRFEPYLRAGEVNADTTQFPRWTDNEVIVSFDTAAIIRSAIDNPHLEYGDAGDFLKPQAIADIQADLGENLNLSQARFIRIFFRLTTDIQWSIGRQGDSVPVSPSWSTLLLRWDEVDENAAAHAFDTAAAVQYAHLNQIATLHAASNDPYLGTHQRSLNEIGGNDTAHINMLPAWDVETGKGDIKVGVYDTGLWPLHEDLGKEIDMSKNHIVKGGWDYSIGEELGYDNLWDFYGGTGDPNKDGARGHGTAIAGIIAAHRNNGKGIAGIAGGSDTLYNGIKLYGMKIWSKQLNRIEIKDIAPAIKEGAVSVHPRYGFGLHVQNHSWGVEIWKQYKFIHGMTLQNQNKDLGLVLDVIQESAANGVIHVASRGNGIDTNDMGVFPACFYDNLALNVTASNYKGLHHPGIYRGIGIDLMAPGELSQVYTTGVDHASHYRSFNGTSAAAPHVSGVAALLISHANNGENSTAYRRPIYPEDVEHLLEKTATDRYTPGYDERSGNGLVNAGAALALAEYPQYRFRHFTRAVPASISTVKALDSVRMDLTRQFVGSRIHNTFEGYAHAYEVTHTINYTLAQGDSIVDAWARGASAIGAVSPATVSNPILLPDYSDCELVSYTNTQAVVKTRVYYMLNDVDNYPVLDWHPVSPQDSRVSFTLHLYNPDYTGPEDGITEKVEAKWKLYPNPAQTKLTLYSNFPLGSKLQYALYNLQGVQLVAGEIKDARGVLRREIDISGLAQGVYVFTLKEGNETFTKKVVVSR